MDNQTVQLFVGEFKSKAQHLGLSFSGFDVQAFAQASLPELLNVEPVYFSKDTEDFVAASAAKNFAQKLQQAGGVEKAQDVWAELVKNFKEGNFWGFPTQNEKPQAPRTNTVKELAVYVWTMIQAFLIMKTVIFYFGLKSSSEEESKFGINTLLLLLAISFSFSSLLFFAWRKNRQK